jgi:hypothetical protein
VGEAQLPAGLGADVKQHVLALASKDAAQRARAACALGEAGAEAGAAIPYLVALMSDGTPLAPSALCKNAEPFEDEAWQPDFEQVYEPSPGEAATQALVALGAPAAEPLLAALKDPNWRTRKNAAWALGHRGDERATPLLAGALSDAAWQVRSEAAYALSQRGGDRVLERLIAALKDEAWQVRAMAALALGQKGDARVLEPLRAATHDRNGRVRGFARTALQMKGGLTSKSSGSKESAESRESKEGMRAGGGAAADSGPVAEQPFDWRGALAAGKSVEVLNVYGDVRAEPAAGGEVEIHAVKRGPAGEVGRVEISVVEHAGGVTVCALFPSGDPKKVNRCVPHGTDGDFKNTGVRVEFVVRVPAGVGLLGRTFNGDITVLLAPAAGAEVRAEVLNGRITSDFALAGQSPDARSFAGRIGGGGQLFDLRTFNGTIKLNRATN